METLFLWKKETLINDTSPFPPQGEESHKSHDLMQIGFKAINLFRRAFRYRWKIVPMLSKEQQRVYEWLKNDLNLPVFAEAYKGAAILIDQKSAGYVSFIAHTGRDLMNGLASTVKGIQSKRVDYQKHIDSIQAVWLDEWRLYEDLSPEVVEKGHLIPIELCQSISNLIDEHNSGRIRSSKADTLFFNTFLNYSDKDKIPVHFLSEWKAAKKWFLRHAHLRSKPFEEEIDNDLVKYFRCLDGYLYIAASSQYNRLRELNEILDTTNR